MLPGLCGCSPEAVALAAAHAGAVMADVVRVPPTLTHLPPLTLTPVAAPSAQPIADLLAEVAPPLPHEPTLEETYAGPVPNRETKKRGSYIPWVRDIQERTEETLEDQLIAMALDPEGREKLEKLLAAEHARASFAEFFRQAWKVIEPTTDLSWNWHLQLICNVMQAVFMDWLHAKRDRKHVNRVRNVIFNVPPGSSKSKIISVCFQAWAWLHWPGMAFIALSVNEDATYRDARAVRDLVKSDWYVEAFKPDWSMKDDQDAVSNYGNTRGGVRLSMPSKSVVVGVRGDCILIDDANDPSETEKERAEVNHMWSSTQSNRVNDMLRSLRIGVQQRTGANDWTEHALEKQGTWWPVEDKVHNRGPGGWLHVVLPAEFEKERKFVLPQVLQDILRDYLPPDEYIVEDPRTEDNQTIDELRMPRSVLDDERKKWAGTGNYAAQMQQRPALLEGARLRRDYWRWFRLDKINDLDTDKGRPRPDRCLLEDKCPAIVVPASKYLAGCWDFDWLVISLDCAAKKTDRGSNWGILVVAGKDGRRYVLDDRTQRGDILEIVEILRELIRKWKPDKVLIEDKAAGPDLKLRLLAEMSKGDMPMVTLESIKVDSNQGKEARLDACIHVIANCMVFLLDGATWLEEFVHEMSQFPFGRYSDRVDALTQVLNFYKDFESDQWPGL